MWVDIDNSVCCIRANLITKGTNHHAIKVSTDCSRP